jgi:hypothetical protein
MIGPINDFLLQASSAINTSDPGAVFIKELMTNIISELVNLSICLTTPELKLFNVTSNSLVGTSLESSCSELGFKKLLRKCMGDIEKAERLINYEIRQSPGRSRDEAIQAAIIRWEMDHR